MREKLLPLRFSILKSLNSEIDGLTPQQIYGKLKDNYPGEKQCQLDTIDGHLMSMKGVGLVEEKQAHFEENEELVTRYTITDYGKGKVKQYIS